MAPGSVETVVPCPATGLVFNRSSRSGSGQGAQAFLRDFPCVSLNLTILGETHGASIVNRNRLVSGGGTGVITVRATLNGSPTCYFDTPVAVGGGCSGGCSGNGACGTGGATARLGSVDVRFDLGKDIEGEPIGDLWLYGQTPSATLGTPAGLRFDFMRPDVDIIRSGAAIRQILTPTCLTDVTTDSPSKYTIRLYSYNSNPERAQQTNLYVPVGQPFALWEVEYPSAGVLTIKKKDASGNVAMSYKYEGATTSSGLTLTLRTLTSSGATLVQESETWTGNVREHSIADDQGAVAFKELETYVNLPDDRRDLSERIVDPDGAHLVTTRTFRSSSPNQGFLETESFSDGSWITYSYDNQGRVSQTTQSYLNTSLTTSGTGTRATSYTYVDQLSSTSIPDESDNPVPTATSGVDSRPRIVTETTDGTVTNKTYFGYREPQTGAKEIIEKRCIKQDSGYDTDTNLVTRKVFLAGNDDRIDRIDFPDGRSDYYAYVPGAFSPDFGNSGNPTFDEGATVKPDLCIIVSHGARDGQSYINALSTRELTYVNRSGYVLFEATEAYAALEGQNPWRRIRWVAYTRDSQGRITSVVRSDHTGQEITRDCCFEETATDEVGMAMTTIRDAAGRVKSQSRTGESNNQSIDTRFYYDAAGRVVRTVEASGNLLRETSQTFDKAGRILTSTDETGLQTLYSYDTVTGGGRKITVTRPGNRTEVTEYFRDGRSSKRTGSGVVTQLTTYGIESDGAQWSRAGIGPGAYPARWTQTWTDIAGRTIRDAKPGWISNSTIHTFYDYYKSYSESGSARKGRLGHKRSQAVISDPAGYTNGGGSGGSGEGGGEPGEGGGTLILYRTIPLSGAGQYSLPSGGPGWLTAPEGAEMVYQYDALGNLRHQATKLTSTGWDDEYQLQFDTDRVRTADIAFNLDDGICLSTQSVVYPGGIPIVVESRREKFTDLGTYETSRITTVDTVGNTTVANRTFNPSDKSSTDSIYLGSSMSTLVARSVSQSGFVRSVASRSGNTTEFQYDALGRQTFVLDPRHTNGSTKYWSETHYNSANRVDFVKDALGKQTSYEYNSAGQLYKITNDAGKITYFGYDLLGRMEKTWGDVPQPVWIQYDPNYGDRIYLHTYRTDAAEMWDQASWPSSAGNGDVTTWTYQNTTGLLKSKTYADNTKVEYTYEDGGSLKTRKWARSGGSLITTYSYKDQTGELEKIDYSDTATHDVDFTYDLLGRPATVTDAVGIHTFTYDPATLKLWKEEISGSGALHTRTITRTYDTTTTHEKGRLVSLSAGSDSTSSYGYDSYGRLNNVRGPGLPGNNADGGGSAGTGVVYTFVPNTDLVEETRFMSSSSTTAGFAKRSFEPRRDLITSIENNWGTTPTLVSKYAYENDNLARRTSVVRTGSAFDTSRVELWGYNTRNELTSAHTYPGTSPTDLGTEVTDRARSYNYDPIGNRTTASEGGLTINYASNNLNQYSAINKVIAPPDGLEGGPVFHDADGNMTDDGLRFTYSWDAENRLISVTPRDPDTGSVQIKFDYDYMSRRVRKRTFAWTGSAWNSAAASDTRFIYDKWNLLLELNGLSINAVIRKYTWGLDLAGQNGNASESGLHAAGGIGGLLGCYDTNGTTTATDDKALAYFYDANGNVGQLIESVSSSSPTPAATYEYDAYGQKIASAGTFGASNPFRFSTKYLIAETGEYDYGRRFYEPRSGPWLSRDPAEEQGDICLYRFNAGAPVNAIDDIGEKARVDVNNTTCTITVTLNIGIYGRVADAGLAQEVKKCIQSFWNQNSTKHGCGRGTRGSCSVWVSANVNYYPNAKHWWSVPEDNQIKFPGDVSRAWVGGVGGTYGRWKRGDCWVYAHEAGHLMGLDDDYHDTANGSIPNPGHAGHMMGSYGGHASQHEIDGIIGGAKCPSNCCCR